MLPSRPGRDLKNTFITQDLSFDIQFRVILACYLSRISFPSRNEYKITTDYILLQFNWYSILFIDQEQEFYLTSIQ